MDTRKMALVIAAAVALAACETTPTRTGGVAGALFFGSVGPTMTEADKQKSIEVIRAGNTAKWRSTNGNEYTFTTLRTYDSGGKTCRDYSIAGGGQSTQGSACQQSSGSWASGA